MAALIDIIFQIYFIVLFARVFLSWFPIDRSNPIVAFIVNSTDPLLKPLARRIPPLGGTIDITPILAFLILHILREVALRLVA